MQYQVSGSVDDLLVGPSHSPYTAPTYSNNNNSLIIECYSIPEGLSSSHFHLGCTKGWNDSVMSANLAGCHL